MCPQRFALRSVSGIHKGITSASISTTYSQSRSATRHVVLLRREGQPVFLSQFGDVDDAPQSKLAVAEAVNRMLKHNAVHVAVARAEPVTPTTPLLSAQGPSRCSPHVDRLDLPRAVSTDGVACV